MAKRMSSKSKKHYPVQRTLRLAVPTPAAGRTEFLVRTDRLASAVNHRLMRQSRVYEVKIDIDANLPPGGVVEVYALADTWYNQKAYNMAKAVFDENSKEENAQLGTTRARWQDFRVNAEPSGTFTEMQVAQYGGGALSTLFAQSEYELSEVSDAAGAVKTFSWTGGGTTQFNIIDEYDVTGNTDQLPTTRTTAVAYDGLDDNLDDSQMEHLSDDGNAPPYDRTGLENQCWVMVARLYVDNNRTHKLSTGYFSAPCGLIRMSTAGGLQDVQLTESCTLTLKGGDYKGVHAPSYLE